jgi:hypothetical protein
MFYKQGNSRWVDRNGGLAGGNGMSIFRGYFLVWEGEKSTFITEKVFLGNWSEMVYAGLDGAQNLSQAHNIGGN